MKYGLYYFKNTHNLGDDIWAYAQSLFYPHIDYLLDNTTVYKFKAKENEDVATIIGAFVEPRNYEYAFFPPLNVIPFFVGAYFRKTMWEFIKNENLMKYLKAYGPIGARTTVTATRFLELGIDAYYSGCISLTLPEMEKHTERYICLVDVPDDIAEYVKNKVGDSMEIKRMTHDLPAMGQDVYLEHRKLSIEERFDIVRERIQIYANAHCVVTSRLHCALPCLTQHTPVLMALPRDGGDIIDMYERMECFFELFHLSYYDEFENGSVDYDFISPPDNPEKYMEYRTTITENTTQFIDQCEKGLIKSRKIFTDEERLEAMTEILENKIFQLKSVVDSKNQIIKRQTSVQRGGTGTTAKTEKI